MSQSPRPSSAVIFTNWRSSEHTHAYLDSVEKGFEKRWREEYNSVAQAFRVAGADHVYGLLGGLERGDVPEAEPVQVLHSMY